MDANIVTRRRKTGDKKWDVTTIPNPLIGDNGRPKDSTGTHVTPIRRSNGGKNSSHTTQLICRKCSHKSTDRCSKCKPTYEIFSGRTGIDCFVKIMKRNMNNLGEILQHLSSLNLVPLYVPLPSVIITQKLPIFHL